MEPYSSVGWKNEVRNGRIPRWKLWAIDPEDFDADLNGPALAHPEAAYNYQKMRVAARADRVVLAISYSYRTFEKQQAKYADYLGPDGIAGTADDGTLAARPGTSNHGWAIAFDLNIERRSSSDPRPVPGPSTQRFKWLQAHAHEYGFDNLDAPSEPWHWTYRGGHPIPEEAWPMTPEERQQVRALERQVAALEKTLADQQKFIVAAKDGMEAKSLAGAGKRVARSVLLTEEG